MVLVLVFLSWIHFHCLLFSFLYYVFTVPCTRTFDQYYSVCKVLWSVLVKPPYITITHPSSDRGRIKTHYS